MSYFDQEFLQFFEGLSQNNDRIWFKKNKKLFEDSVKNPFVEFIQELILRLQEEDPTLITIPKESIFRIYRDIRFSKDKTPYKPHVSASINTGGKKAIDTPGYYIQLSFNRVMIGGGLYNPSKEGLYKIRTYISQEPQKLSHLINSDGFKEKYGQIKEDKNKRLPMEFKKFQNEQPLIANKQFYYMHEDSKGKRVLEADFPDYVLSFFKVGMPINNFLKKAL